MAKQQLLFICDDIPTFSGSGTPMRAASHIRVLSEFFDITLAIMGGRVSDAYEERSVPIEISGLCKSIIVINKISITSRMVQRFSSIQSRLLYLALLPTPFSFSRIGAALVTLAQHLAGSSFEVIHCFRLNTGRAPRLFKRHGIAFDRAVLDFDAYESEMAFRCIGPVIRLTGRQPGVVQWLEGLKWRVLERLLIPQFDDVYVSSELDRLKLHRRFPKNRWHVIPNIMPAPAKVSHDSDRRFTFLFVGLLSYPPNADAVSFYCNEMLPILYNYGFSFRTLIVGRQAGELLRFNAMQGVDVISDPPEISPFYAQADVAIVPLRAGGGTRVKILEAFSYGLPVIATSMGAEGLGVTPETDILIADDPKDFAYQCYRLWMDASLRRRIASAGHKLWLTNYNPTSLRTALASVL